MLALGVSSSFGSTALWATKFVRPQGATKNFIESASTEIFKYPSGDRNGSTLVETRTEVHLRFFLSAGKQVIKIEKVYSRCKR